jgi:hypothetical protein
MFFSMLVSQKTFIIEYFNETKCQMKEGKILEGGIIYCFHFAFPCEWNMSPNKHFGQKHVFSMLVFQKIYLLNILMNETCPMKEEIRKILEGGITYCFHFVFPC